VGYSFQELNGAELLCQRKMPFLQKKPIFLFLPQKQKEQSTRALFTYTLMSYALTCANRLILIFPCLRGYFLFFAC